MASSEFLRPILHRGFFRGRVGIFRVPTFRMLARRFRLRKQGRSTLRCLRVFVGVRIQTSKGRPLPRHFPYFLRTHFIQRVHQTTGTGHRVSFRFFLRRGLSTRGRPLGLPARFTSLSSTRRHMWLIQVNGITSGRLPTTKPRLFRRVLRKGTSRFSVLVPGFFSLMTFNIGVSRSRVRESFFFFPGLQAN